MDYKSAIALALIHCCCVVFALADDLQQAIQTGKLEIVQSLIQTSPELRDGHFSSGLSPLNLAASLGQSDIVAYLLSIGADIETVDNEGSQPVHNAAAFGATAIVESLVAKGSRLDAVDLNGMTPLLFASSRGHLDLVKWLVDHGADVNLASKQGLTPFFYSVISGNADMADYLLNHHAEWNVVTTAGITPLHSAASRNRPGMVDKLLKLGMKVDAVSGDGVTPLFWAAGARGAESVKLLIDAGANVKHRSRDGQTALHFASNRGSIETVRLLLEKGAEVDAMDRHGWTPLGGAVGGNSDVAKYLMLNGASVNPRWSKSETAVDINRHPVAPLHQAARHADIDMVRLLVENGATVNARNEEGHTALYGAVQRNKQDVVAYLLDRGAITGAKDSAMGRTELHIAAILGNRDIASMLVQHGAEMNAMDDQKKNPLDYAFFHGFKHLGYDLLAAGADDAHLGEQIAMVTQKEPQISEGQAKLWHLGHSAWAVKTQNHMMVFDYAPGPGEVIPEDASLDSGYVIPEQLKNENLYVFVSHQHGDHYSPECFEWAHVVARTHYVMGFDPQRAQADYTTLGPRKEVDIEGVRVFTVQSTDQGVGFLIEVDGLVLFHAGDHASGTDETIQAFRSEIDALKQRNVPIDIAFFPVVGCGIGDQAKIRSGIEYAVNTLAPEVIVPMHAGDQFGEYQAFAQYANQKNFKSKIIYPTTRGDRFEYPQRHERDGRDGR